MLLGLEIASQHAAAVLADETGAVQYSLRQAFAPHSPPATQWLSAMELCRDLLRRAALEPSAIQRAGIAFNAPVSTNNVVQRDPTRPGWDGYDLARGVREHLRIENVVATSHINAEALGEMQFGALRGQSDWLYLHLGRVFESALCLDGKMRIGGGAAGDMGGLIIDRDGSIDAFGSRGTLRAYCGGDAFEGRARSYGLTFTQASEVWKVAPTNFAAQSVTEDFTSRLAQGLSGVLSFLEPAQVCVGGAFGNAIWSQIQAPLASKLRDMNPSGAHKFSLLVAKLGEDAAPLGAVALALRTAT
jgi:predicted NBD/HSP70 family sugar kinase